MFSVIGYFVFLMSCSFYTWPRAAYLLPSENEYIAIFYIKILDL